MPTTRAGHHGDVSYVFEDAGFNTSPTDEEFKNFGGNATLDTFDGSHNAVRVFNADRKAADIIGQNFDGSWSITLEGFTEPPWWLAGLFGQPVSSELTTGLYEHIYSIGDGNTPVPLRLYAPTEGFSDYRVLGGCVVASTSVDQDAESSPEITVSGAYAGEPTREATLDPQPPQFSQTSFSNRDATLTADGGTVGKAQSTTFDLSGNAEMINEIGSEEAVDFTPRAFEPSVDFEKILWVGQTTDPFDLFVNSGQFGLNLNYDNGASDTDQYAVDIDATGALANELTESGRNDPSADLTESLSNMVQDATATITVDADTPPGV